MPRIKVAWIRDPEAPAGRPAKGRLNCPCGNAPLTEYKPEQGHVECACGRFYTWNGHILPMPDIQRSHYCPECRHEDECHDPQNCAEPINRICDECRPPDDAGDRKAGSEFEGARAARG